MCKVGLFFLYKVKIKIRFRWCFTWCYSNCSWSATRVLPIPDRGLHVWIHLSQSCDFEIDTSRYENQTRNHAWSERYHCGYGQDNSVLHSWHRGYDQENHVFRHNQNSKGDQDENHACYYLAYSLHHDLPVQKTFHHETPDQKNLPWTEPSCL